MQHVLKPGSFDIPSQPVSALETEEQREARLERRRTAIFVAVVTVLTLAFAALIMLVLSGAMSGEVQRPPG